MKVINFKEWVRAKSSSPDFWKLSFEKRAHISIIERQRNITDNTTSLQRFEDNLNKELDQMIHDWNKADA